MRESHTFALGTAGFLLLGAGSVFFLRTQITHTNISLASEATYGITAKFDNIGDLGAGAPVSISGVEIGRVTGIGFDPMEHKAVISMQISREFSSIPKDSNASINTQGLLGRKFISLTSGRSDAYLEDQDKIVATRSAMSIENMVSQLLTHYLDAKDRAAMSADKSNARQ